MPHAAAAVGQRVLLVLLRCCCMRCSIHYTREAAWRTNEMGGVSNHTSMQARQSVSSMSQPGASLKAAVMGGTTAIYRMGHGAITGWVCIKSSSAVSVQTFCGVGIRSLQGVRLGLQQESLPLAPRALVWQPAAISQPGSCYRQPAILPPLLLFLCNCAPLLAAAEVASQPELFWLLQRRLHSRNFSGLAASSGVGVPVLIQWQKGTSCGRAGSSREAQMG